MTKTIEFMNVVRCLNCDHVKGAGRMRASWHDSFSVCGCCGGRKFYEIPDKWISQSVWWNPLSYGKGHWLSGKSGGIESGND